MDRPKNTKDPPELVQALNIVRGTPDCDLGKVLSIKERIKNGAYRVPTEKLAENILVDNLFEAFFFAAEIAN